MANSYIQQVMAETPTRIWINNPTGAELEKSLRAGCIAGTTNPTYCARLLREEPEFIEPIIRQAVAEEENDNIAADMVVQRATQRFMQAYLPLYRASNGRHGFVTIQDDPRRDHAPDLIVEAALRHRKVAPNYMAKVPVTEAGIAAIVELVKRNIPITATEVFAISQAVVMCEVFEQACAASGNCPAFYITQIAGIFDEELAEQARVKQITIVPEVLRQAGSLVGRKQYHLIKARGYRATLLGGGARGMHHFTEFVGGDFHVTMNWSTVEELNRTGGPMVARIDAPAPPEVVEELCAKFGDFRLAWEEGAMVPEEFEPYAPLQRFRNNFVSGYEKLVHACAALRNEPAATGAVRL